MENVSFRILRMCIFVYATELQIVQFSSLPDPCPDDADNTIIGDMCTNDFASEDSKTGSAAVDSVALRVMTQQDECKCEVSLQNQYNKHTVYMRKYGLLTSAAPEMDACGLAIDIVYTSPGTLPENKAPIECTKGTNTRSVLLSQNGALHLKSRIIGDNFSRGYCIQIHRQHTTGDKTRIQINCSLFNMQTTQQDKAVSSNMPTTQQDKTISSNMQTTQHMTDTEIQNDTVTSNLQTTWQMVDAAIEDKTVSGTNSTLFIAIGVGSAVVIALIVAVTIIIIRRKGNENKNGIEVQPDIDSNDDDSDGLKYNCLYNTSEQNIMEGDYHIVDIERKQNPGIQNFDSEYSTVDGNYSSVGKVNMPAIDGSITDNKIKSVAVTTPRPVIQPTEEEESNNGKHVTPMSDSNVEYAIVDKRGITDKKVKHVSAPHDSNVEYAVIDKR